MASILILTAGFGEGHNAAARALAETFNEDQPGTARLVDLFAETSPRLNAVLRKAYLAAINGAPRIWSVAYQGMDQPLFMRLVERFLGAERAWLEALIAREHPVAVCCTFPAYAFLLKQLAREGRASLPHYNIVTDSISINSLWWRPGCDGWFVPNEDSAAVMREAGVDATRLHVTGFPVPAFFSRNTGLLSPPDLSAGARPRVLYIVNSGTRNAEATARLLLAEAGWDLTCAVGRDEDLRRTLLEAAAARGRSVEILGWTDQIPHLLMTHHAVISKAGGATTQEAIAARCPMIVNQVVPGQEEGNYELLRRHKAGALATTPETVIGTLREAFADQGRLWSRWRAALGPLARPDAARAIADRVRAECGLPKGPTGDSPEKSPADGNPTEAFASDGAPGPRAPAAPAGGFRP